MLLPEHYKVGQKVRCVHVGQHTRTGKTGVIKNVAGRSIDVKWDDGWQADTGLGEPASFDPIDDEKSVPVPDPIGKAPALVGVPIPLDVCKKHYYGIQEPCTCKVRK